MSEIEMASDEQIEKFEGSVTERSNRAYHYWDANTLVHSTDAALSLIARIKHEKQRADDLVTLLGEAHGWLMVLYRDHLHPAEGWEKSAEKLRYFIARIEAEIEP